MKKIVFGVILIIILIGVGSYFLMKGNDSLSKSSDDLKIFETFPCDGTIEEYSFVNKETKSLCCSGDISTYKRCLRYNEQYVEEYFVIWRDGLKTKESYPAPNDPLNIVICDYNYDSQGNLSGRYCDIPEY